MTESEMLTAVLRRSGHETTADLARDLGLKVRHVETRLEAQKRNGGPARFDLWTLVIGDPSDPEVCESVLRTMKSGSDAGVQTTWTLYSERLPSIEVALWETRVVDGDWHQVLDVQSYGEDGPDCLGLTPTEAIAQYAAGDLSRGDLVDQLVQWPYLPSDRLDGPLDDLFFHVNGSLDDVERAMSSGALPGDVYVEILDRLQGGIR